MDTGGYILLHIDDASIDATKGDIDGLYGRLPPDLMKLVRKIADAPNYDFAAMEMLDHLGVEWRKS